jgi:hypothetical protein
MLRKLVSFLLIFTIIILSATYPVYATSSSGANLQSNISSFDMAVKLPDGVEAVPKHLLKFSQKSSKFIKSCLLSQPSNGIEEIGCGLLKTSIQAGVVVVVCYSADGVATSIFPPAGTLAPFCSYLGVAKSGEKLVDVVIH